MSKKRNPLPYPLVLIEWLDHTSNDSWLDNENIKNEAGGAKIISVGWLVHEDKNSYVISGGMDANGAQSTTTQTIMKKLAKKTVIYK
jgi:hypothetical protein